MTERQAVVGAGLAHLLLFAALSIGWQLTRQPLPMIDESVPVEVVEIADAPRVTELPRPSIKAAPQETVEAAEPEPAPPEPKAATPPEPKPEPAPEPKPDPEPKPKPDSKPLDTAKLASVLDKVAPKAKPLDSQKLANLIDRALPKAKVKPLDTSALATEIAAASPKKATIDPRAAATLAQAIRAQVAPCWNPPIGGADVRKMTVVLRADFGRDGAVIGVPSKVSQTGATAANAAYAKAFADTAVRAVLRCSPLKLPPKLYDLWKSVEINFDPDQMT